MIDTKYTCTTCGGRHGMLTPCPKEVAKIYVFAMNDCDWVASTSAESAREWYLTKYMNESINSGDEFCDLEPRQLSEDEMNNLTYNDWDGFLKGEPDTYTFNEALDMLIKREDSDTFFFATTEY